MNIQNISSQANADSLAPVSITVSDAIIDCVDTTTPNAFEAMGLAPELVQAVSDMGYTQPTEVQQRTIPLAMQGSKDDAENVDSRYVDLMVSSQTGSGKTAAFLLPVAHTLIHLQRIAKEQEKEAFEKKAAEALAQGLPAPKRPKRKNPMTRRFEPAVPGALVLCPTRELAMQVARDAIDLLRHSRSVRVANIIGGMPYAKQLEQLRNANLVVATPGRLLDLQRSGQIKLDKVQFLVVDEADRMLDLGFSEDLEAVHQLTAHRKQTMMFSATFAPRIQQLGMRVMHDGGKDVQRIEIASAQQKHENITQKLFWADTPQHKRLLLDNWLRDPEIEQAIVFASTQIECDNLAADLQQAGFSAVALHGALSQGLRSRRLSALRLGKVKILVATDVAARGIDVPTISHVFNFGLPMKAEDYTHRIGRTGRAGRNGLAITFAEFRDRRRIFDIEGFTRQQLDIAQIPGLEPKQDFPQWRKPGAKGHHGRNGGNGGARRNGGGSFGARSFRGNDRSERSFSADGARRERFGGSQEASQQRPWGGSRDRNHSGDARTPSYGEHRSAADRGFNVKGHANGARKNGERSGFSGRRSEQFSRAR